MNLHVQLQQGDPLAVMIPIDQFGAPGIEGRLIEFEICPVLMHCGINVGGVIESSTAHLGAEAVERCRCFGRAAKARRHEVPGRAVLGRRPLEIGHRGGIVLQIGIEELERVARHPGVSGDAVLALIIGLLRLTEAVPIVLVPLIHRAELRMDQPQHPHGDEISMRPRIEDIRAVVLARVVEPAGLLFESDLALGELEQRNRHLFRMNVADLLHDPAEVAQAAVKADQCIDAVVAGRGEKIRQSSPAEPRDRDSGGIRVLQRRCVSDEKGNVASLCVGAGQIQGHVPARRPEIGARDDHIAVAGEVFAKVRVFPTTWMRDLEHR